MYLTLGQAFQYVVDRSYVMYYKLSHYNCLHLTITSQLLAAKILLWYCKTDDNCSITNSCDLITIGIGSSCYKIMPHVKLFSD
jgi:hypothetical protein